MLDLTTSAVTEDPTGSSHTARGTFPEDAVARAHTNSCILFHTNIAFASSTSANTSWGTYASLLYQTLPPSPPPLFVVVSSLFYFLNAFHKAIQTGQNQ